MAWVLDTNSSLAYGPLAINGCRVLQSETPIEIVDEEHHLPSPDVLPNNGLVSRCLRGAAYAVVILGVCLLAIDLCILAAGLFILLLGAPWSFFVFLVNSTLLFALMLVTWLFCGWLGKFVGRNFHVYAWWLRVPVWTFLWLMTLLLLAAQLLSAF